MCECILVEFARGTLLHCDFTKQGKIVDLSKKSPNYTDKNKDSDSAEVSCLVYLPRLNMYLFVLLQVLIVQTK